MAKKPEPRREIIVELPPKSVVTGRKKPAPRVVVEISEGSATLVRCPFKDVDIVIHDYDVPEDWDGGEDIGQRDPAVETGVSRDVFGRRYQYIKFKRRSKTPKKK